MAVLFLRDVISDDAQNEHWDRQNFGEADFIDLFFDTIDGVNAAAVKKCSVITRGYSV